MRYMCEHQIQVSHVMIYSISLYRLTRAADAWMFYGRRTLQHRDVLHYLSSTNTVYWLLCFGCLTYELNK
uniref:Uncharacterized protein n=1 Tax=Rhizophora mucronata TaxID=61149 RepID=A0A2P2Q9J9_RHIMU